MSKQDKSVKAMPISAWLLVICGCIVIAFGWMVPSRFKSVPFGVVRQAGVEGSSLADIAREQFMDGNFSAARSLAEAASSLGDKKAALTLSQVTMELEASAQLARWGAWDPFLEAALDAVPLEAYSSEPGLLGILIAEACRQPVAALLENSRNPLVGSLLESGAFTTYKRLFPVSSSSGRPLEVTLLGLGLLAQGDHFSSEFRQELRDLLMQAKATGDVGALEDVYLDSLSLMRIFDWGQFSEVASRLRSSQDLQRLRYLLHRRSENQALVFAMTLASERPAELFDYLEAYGDEGFERLRFALGTGVGGYRLALREQLPIELAKLESAGSYVETLQNAMAPYSLRQPRLSLAIKYGCFFVGSFIALFGLSRFGQFYKERASPALAFTQRFFGASASVLVFAVLSEPYLANAGAFEGYSFRFVMPVLANVDGELQVVETTPTISMEPATLLSIAFFLLLQVLVFLICLLKVREIERRELDPLVKLKLMENEENLFDSGLYVGIAGTCISLVMQVIHLVEANLLAAYSSNLFGILCVAIVKIRLVRPYKTKLIMAGQSQIAKLVKE
ncbi:hypothetical protein [Pelagicoccus sp. SDUM812003]|uniref:hypothetical protein n=1 Tax=Pelagicoccus sp. SDUM812003 TaxID=3041267 RepID=UPI00280D18CD|nr:hypothetical protein [Pelagicoccus sp. SDUM812003]MDQ8202521.1 hypothetical protein [Pelagicoccus sp. SDUM812003]